MLGLKKREFTAPVRDEALYQEVRGKIEEALHEAMDTSKYIKLESHRKISDTAKGPGGQLSRRRCGQAQAGGALC